MTTKKYNYGSQFRIAASRAFIEYLDEDTKTWQRYTDQDMGYIVMLNEWNLVSSEGVYFRSADWPLVWDRYNFGDIISEWESDEEIRDWRKEIYEDMYYPLVSVAQTMDQIQKLPLIRMFSDAVRRHDLPQFTFCLLAWLDYRVMDFHLDTLVEKKAISGLSILLKEDMSETERHRATCDLLNDVLSLTAYVQETHFDMFSSDKYLALLVNDFPFIKEMEFSEYYEVADGVIRSNCTRYDNKVNLFNWNNDVEFSWKNIYSKVGEEDSLESKYNTKQYMKSPVFVKEAIYLPKLFRDYEQKHPEGWGLTSGDEEIDRLLAVAWENHDIIKLVWWFCIASQIKSEKRHFDNADILAGKNGNINHMYRRLLEWDVLEEEWFDPADMPFWKSKCIRELTFLAEDALFFFGARK